MRFTCYQDIWKANKITEQGGTIIRAGSLWIEYWSPMGRPLVEGSWCKEDEEEEVE